jgi:hypothetical protein
VCGTYRIDFLLEVGLGYVPFQVLPPPPRSVTLPPMLGSSVVRDWHSELTCGLTIKELILSPP